MSQHSDIISTQPHYTRADFTALRAFLNKLPVDTIASLYYDEDDLEERGLATTHQLSRYLEGMRDDLMQRATDANPELAESLRRARQNYLWSKLAISHLVQAADLEASQPQRADPVSQWLKPIAARQLKSDGIVTLGDLIRIIEGRGKGWYRPIGRLGRRKAGVIEQWLRKHERSLGTLPYPLADSLPMANGQMVTLSPAGNQLAPLERLSVRADLDGSCGDNRARSFPLISAPNDLRAMEAFIIKHREQPKTARAYTKELERFLCWSVMIRGKPMSSLVVEDCEAYKLFLESPPASWRGPRRPRSSGAWKPFVGVPSAVSRRYAVRVLRTFFNYLCSMRYLGGNPWDGVKDPKVDTEVNPIQIEKALPAKLWNKLSDEGGILDQMVSLSNEALIERLRLNGAGAIHRVDAQARLARAMILLLGMTGMRREELATVQRKYLKVDPANPNMWKLEVLGKGGKRRIVYPSQREIEAVRGHWADRGNDFNAANSELYLVSPVNLARTDRGRDKHGDELDPGRGFSPDGIYKVVTTWLKRIANDMSFDLTVEERAMLKETGIHAFRHTFGTQAAADKMPLDVIQKIMGHSSLNTTTIYVQSEEERAAREMGEWRARRSARSQ